MRGEVRQLLRALGITAVIVTHDQEEALSLAGEVAVMIDGRVLQVGSPLEVYSRPVSRAVGEFVGAANVLHGMVEDSHVDTVLGRFYTRVGIKGPVDVMFRAESLAISEEGGVPAEIVDVDYYGHDQMVVVRLNNGETLRLRLLALPEFEIGQHVGVVAQGEPFIFAREA